MTVCKIIHTFAVKISISSKEIIILPRKYIEP